MKKHRRSKFLALMLALVILASTIFAGCGDISRKVAEYLEANSVTPAQQIEELKAQIVEDGTYTSKMEVAAYIKKYGHLPSNFITQQQARDLGWVSKAGNLTEVAPGKSIGGDELQYKENKIAQAAGRIYYECDINYSEGIRGAERLVYSNDGMIYYSPDHFKTFELLCGAG